MREEIERTGGTVEKFAGDAVMAVFGAPAAFEDHAERALHAALAMQERMKGLFDGELGLRIGVNTGDVVVGVAHEGGSFVTGDVVNVADRLQKGAEPGEVLAGERTVAAVARAFEFEAPRAVEAKGKTDGVVASPVVRALRTMRPRGVGGLRRVFVGRDNELELLRVTYRRAAAQSEPHLVTLVGEPGVGKSTLVSELWEALATEEPPPVNRTGRCLAYGTGITYHPLGEILREHYELREGAALDEVEARLAGREILALALGLDVAPDMHPLDARERLHAAAVSFFEELSSACPTVVVIEDIHWAEPDLLDLLERLATDVRGPVMLVATARPEVVELRPTWGLGKRNATVLWLDPLSAAAVSQLLEEKLPRLPDDLRDRLVERADGNPFFLEELVGELVDSGALVQSGDELDGRPLRRRLRDAGHRARGARGADRPPPGAGEVRASGRRSRRPRVLGHSGGASPRRRGAGLRGSRGAGSRDRASHDCGRRPRVRHQARAHARGCVWIDSKGSQRPTACVLRRMARASLRRGGRARAAPRTPLLGGGESA